VFVYTTLNHIKYALPNGDSGIIRTLDTPVYLTKVFGNTVYCLDRDGRNRQVQIDTTEYMFKLSLIQRRYDQVLSMIRGNALCGQSIIAYLQSKGFPEVALHFVKDERTRFNLALECGNIEVALASAQELDDKDTWHRLGVESLRQGNHQIVEFAYQKTKNFERLSFLYLITGNKEKLIKMLKISEMRSDVMGQFHNALYLGDVRERVKILEAAGHIPLAYLTARTHGLAEDADRLASDLEESGAALPEVGDIGKLMPPPTPILLEDNWPLLTVTKGFFEGVLSGEGGGEGYTMGMDDDDVGGAGGWGDDLDIPDVGLGNEVEEDPLAVAGLAPEPGEEGEEDEDAGWEMEDLELPPDMGDAGLESPGARGSDEVFIAPTAGVPVARRWTQKSAVAGEHAAAGDFDSAMRLLHRQLGVCNFAPLTQNLLDAAFPAHAPLGGVTGAPSLAIPLGRGWTADEPTNSAPSPALVSSLPVLEDKLKAAYKTTTEGKFGEALKLFTAIIHNIALLLVESRREVDEVRELLGIAREYAIALRIEMKRKETKDDVNRQAELAAYFTHCPLQPIHLSLSLRSAMSIFFKLKNYNTAAGFCRRLLELNPPAKVAQQAKQVLQACERTPKDEVELKYDSRNPFVVCSATFEPIYRGTKDSACPMCGAKYVADQAGSICHVCNLGKIGADATGLMVSPSQQR